jgi:hypothetical protein
MCHPEIERTASAIKKRLVAEVLSRPEESHLLAVCTTKNICHLHMTVPVSGIYICCQYQKNLTKFQDK